MKFWPVFVDDNADYPMTDHGFDTQAEAEQAIEDFWVDFFKRNPRGVVHYLDTSIRVRA